MSGRATGEEEGKDSIREGTGWGPRRSSFAVVFVLHLPLLLCRSWWSSVLFGLSVAWFVAVRRAFGVFCCSPLARNFAFFFSFWRDRKSRKIKTRFLQREWISRFASVVCLAFKIQKIGRFFGAIDPRTAPSEQEEASGRRSRSPSRPAPGRYGGQASTHVYYNKATCLTQ